MSPSSAIKILLLAATLLGAESIDTREIQFSTYNAFTVAIGSHLFTVSKYSSRIVVNSTDPSYKSCDAAFHVNQGPVGPSIKAAATKSKKIMVTSLQSYDFVPNDKESVRYTILLVDPFACSVAVLESPTEVTQSSPLLPPEIVAREDDTFDVFYWSQTACSPCRYDDQGKRVKLQHDLKPERYRALEFHLHELSQSHNYAYTFDYGGDDATLKVLDRDFNAISFLTIGPVVKDFADSYIAKSALTYIGAVLKVPDNSFIYNYTVFEYKTELRPVFSKLITMSKDYQWPIGAEPKIDSKGTSYVAVWQSSISVNGTLVTLARYNAKGVLVDDAIEIGKVAFNQQYRTQTFLLQDEQYCLVVHEIGWNEPDLTKIKCFDFLNKV